MNKVNSIFQIGDVVLDTWQKQWNCEDGFSMNCGKSFYYVPPHNKYDMWVWVRSDAKHPRFRGRVDLYIKICNCDDKQPDLTQNKHHPSCPMSRT